LNSLADPGNGTINQPSFTNWAIGAVGANERSLEEMAVLLHPSKQSLPDSAKSVQVTDVDTETAAPRAL